MQRPHSLLFLLVLPALNLGVLGCSDPMRDRMPVTIKVTLKSAPLSNGTVSIEPLEGQDTRGGGSIEKGECKLDKANGLKPGKYLVRFTAGDGKTPADSEAGAPGGSTNIVSKDLIPEEYGINSKQEITVKKGDPNLFEFKIP